MFERRHRDEDGDRIHGQNRHLHDDREHQPNRNRNHDRRPGILINNVVVRHDPNKNNDAAAITPRATRAAQDKLDRAKTSLEDWQARLRDKAREVRVLQHKVDRAQEDVVRARRERDLLCVADEKEREREKQEKRRREREREREREERDRQNGRGNGHGHAKGRGVGVRVERMERVEVERKMYWRFSD
ncbi:hypothetical protein LTR46_006598 [Exophiala xenobiotica]|nr:hypothetical protein LTR46_006598 [Exophiala xenobiotica]